MEAEAKVQGEAGWAQPELMADPPAQRVPEVPGMGKHRESPRGTAAAQKAWLSSRKQPEKCEQGSPGARLGSPSSRAAVHWLDRL